MKSLSVGSRHRIQTLKEGSAKDPQPTKGWTVTEVFDSLQLLLIATCPAIVWLGSISDPRQRPNLAVPRDKTNSRP